LKSEVLVGSSWRTS